MLKLSNTEVYWIAGCKTQIQYDTLSHKAIDVRALVDMWNCKFLLLVAFFAIRWASSIVRIWTYTHVYTYVYICIYMPAYTYIWSLLVKRSNSIHPECLGYKLPPPSINLLILCPTADHELTPENHINCSFNSNESKAYWNEQWFSNQANDGLSIISYLFHRIKY